MWPGADRRRSPADSPSNPRITCGPAMAELADGAGGQFMTVIIDDEGAGARNGDADGARLRVEILGRQARCSACTRFRPYIEIERHTRQQCAQPRDMRRRQRGGGVGHVAQIGQEARFEDFSSAGKKKKKEGHRRHGRHQRQGR